MEEFDTIYKMPVPELIKSYSDRWKEAHARLSDAPFKVSELSNNSGTEYYWECPKIESGVMTDGVFDCYCNGYKEFITFIFVSYLLEKYKSFKNENFLTFEFTDGKFIVTDGNDNILYNTSLEGNICANDGVKFWLIQNVLMLPSEY